MSPAPTTSGALRDDDPKVVASRKSATVPFRSIIPAPDHPKVAGISDYDAHTWLSERGQKIPPIVWLQQQFSADNVPKPFKGITTDGEVVPNLYSRATEPEHAAPTQAMKDAADRLISILTAEQKEAVLKPLDTDELRIWSNPGGIRLDETTVEVQEAIHELIKASTSPLGYEKILGCCRTNHFLGQLVNGTKVLNQHSYNFRLFGEPSIESPWAYTFFGHHLSLAVAICGSDLTISPTFFGAEPDLIDEGPWAGTRLFHSEESEGLKLMQSLPEVLQTKAQIFESMQGEDLPEDRWNPFDERHLGGAFKDNRVIPFEGVRGSEFDHSLRSALLNIVKSFNEHLPAGPLAARMSLVEKHLDETYFAWIGRFGDDDPIQSPVVLCEFDFHAGIFLTNSSPAKCHVHTLQRQPNGNDYGMAIREAWSRANSNVSSSRA